MTCLAWPDISESDGHVARALESRGVAVTPRAWNDPEASFDGFDAVIFRSSWDYHHAPEAYLAWLSRWEAEGVRFWNPPALIRWNLTKRYLLDLERAGVPVIPTVVLEHPAVIHLPAVLAERGWTKAVVKPVLGASAHDAAVVGSDDCSAVAAAIDDGRLRRPVLVQPFIEEITARGEWSLVFIEGVLTHAMVKHPGAGDFRVQARYGGTSAHAQASPTLERAALRALEALPVAPLYARVDGVETGDGFLVMEVEVHEPGLFFPAAPEAAQAFAEAILRRL